MSDPTIGVGGLTPFQLQVAQMFFRLNADDVGPLREFFAAWAAELRRLTRRGGQLAVRGRGFACE